MAGYKLIAMDLDGTLKNDKKEIPKHTLNALIEYERMGIRLALASARPFPGLLKEADELEMSKYGGILMAYNGGRIALAGDGQIISQTVMDAELARQVLKELKKYPVVPILDDGRQFFVTDKTGYKVDYECANNNMTCTEVEDLSEFIFFAPAKILLSADPAKIGAIEADIASWLPAELSVVQTAAFYLEIIPAIVDKGRGIREICSACGLLPAEIIAFGDAENDIPMLKAAGLGVAMGNAQARVKAAADLVTLSNNEDGIAVCLKKVLQSSPGSRESCCC